MDFLTKTLQYINTNKMFNKTANVNCKLNLATKAKLDKVISDLNRRGFKDIPRWQIILAGLLSLDDNNKDNELIKIKAKYEFLKNENIKLVSDMNKLNYELMKLRRQDGNKDRTSK